MQPPRPHRLSCIPTPLPRERVLSRLGYNRHLTSMTPAQQALIDTHMQEGYALCHPQGTYIRLPLVQENDTSVINNETRWESRSLSEFLRGCSDVLLLGATIGSGLETAAHAALVADEGARGMVLDAVGSETADATLDWLQQYCARELRRSGCSLTKFRFSPGYGDVPLSIQKDLFEYLQMEALGVQLSDSFQMSPEKSVLAIVGVQTAQA